MIISLNQIDLIAAISNEIERQAKGQGIASIPVIPRHFNAIISAANSVRDAFLIAPRLATPGMGLHPWLSSDDTGLSSRAMAARLCGSHVPETERHYHPLDPEDFGRCHRFLEAVPFARPHLAKMADVSPIWSRLVAHWDELTTLYLEELPTGVCPKLYARMQALISPQ